MLTRVAQSAERALHSIERSDGLLEDEQVKAAHDLLRELVERDVQVLAPMIAWAPRRSGV